MCSVMKRGRRVTRKRRRPVRMSSVTYCPSNLRMMLKMGTWGWVMKCKLRHELKLVCSKRVGWGGEWDRRGGRGGGTCERRACAREARHDDVTSLAGAECGRSSEGTAAGRSPLLRHKNRRAQHGKLPAHTPWRPPAKRCLLNDPSAVVHNGHGFHSGQLTWGMMFFSKESLNRGAGGRSRPRRRKGTRSTRSPPPASAPVDAPVLAAALALPVPASVTTSSSPCGGVQS